LLKLRKLMKYDGSFDDIISDYCKIFYSKYKYSIRNQINNIFYDISDSKKDGYVLMDGDELVGLIIFHVDLSVGVVHFFHMKEPYSQIKAFKTIFQHMLEKIKQNLPKIVFLTEIFNFGPKQRRTLMSQFDFEEKLRDHYILNLDEYKINPDCESVIEFRHLEYENLEMLSEITYFSFAGSMELEVYPVGFERDDFIQQLQNTMNGIYGRYLSDYSYEVYLNEDLIGLILSLSNGDTVELHQFLLAPRSWGKGYGYSMLNMFASRVKEKGEFTLINTMVSHENLKVRKLIENMGFELMAEVPVFTRILK